MSSGYEVREDVAVITMNHPPVNGLDVRLRKFIVESVGRAASDSAVRAIVIAGTGRVFCAGADIREFNTSQMAQEPTLWSLLDVIEGSAKPVVAAMHTLAFGGGLELALSAHYRVASPRTQLGLPEVKIGLLPGAGGTQRLPRAVGLEIALNMIVAGTPVASEDIAHTRLLDRIVEGDLLSGAVEFAREIALRPAPFPKVRDWSVEHSNAEGFLSVARTAITSASGELPAPAACVDAVEAAVQKPFEAGLKVERALFQSLLETSESKALRHVFFAERAASRPVGLNEGASPRNVQSVAVIGAGTMGTGISLSFLNAGFPVHLLEADLQALDRGVATIRSTYENRVRAGKLSIEQMESRLSLLVPTLSYGSLETADLLIEAVYEDYDVKRGIFRQLDAVARPGAILATNTSTLDVDRIAAYTGRPQDVLGLHFFSPAHVMKLLEIVRGAETADEIVLTALDVARVIGKTPVVCGVCDGFIGNRMVEQYLRQAYFLLEEGALPGQVDRAIEKFGFAMGPFRMSDLAGNDIGRAIRKRRYQERPDMLYSQIADRICEAQRFGQKSGAGWYDYRPGERTALPSNQVAELILNHSQSLSVTRRAISDEEIVGRLVYALANEGALILKEGIAARASDIDVVYVSGYGFPAWRGGPMFYADTVGPYNVVRAISSYSRGYQGDTWVPAPQLVRLATTGEKFNE